MSLLKEANNCFKNEKYMAAYKLYQQAKHQYGFDFLDFNIEMCRKKIDNDKLLLNTVIPTKSLDDAKTIDIILPIYNALEDVKNCINSLYEHKTYNFNLIAIDDCSDDETKEYLENEAKLKGFKLLRNSENLRFTKTVNRGFKESHGDFVVLLNSDTIITSRWIEKILACFESDSNIGIVGPLSNAASWQTVPVQKDPNTNDWLVNEIPVGYSIEEMGMLVETISKKEYPRVPSVNGFCYFIKREVLDKIGVLDTKYFPTGYGEEDDFSIRATNEGFTCVISDDTYIYHAKSKSYTHEVRKVLTKGGRKSLDEKHGKLRIKQLIKEWIEEPRLPQIAARIESYMHRANKNKKVVYTAIFGKYDLIREPEYINEDWDYVCFTDNKELTSDSFIIKYVEPIHNNSTKNARMIKLLSHIFLIDYNISLWIDGNVKLRGENIDELLKKHQNDYLALHQHIVRTCVYEEHLACSKLQKDNQLIMKKQIDSYKKDGMPSGIGLVETAEIFRNHLSDDTKLFNSLWWKELNKYSIRDQLSFNYVCWKNNFTYALMQGTAWLDPYINLYKHGINKQNDVEADISIIMVLNNEPLKDIKKSISNILKQTNYSNYKLIIEHNICNKDVEEFLVTIAMEYKSKIDLHKIKNSSAIRKKNNLARSCHTGYVCFIKPLIKVIEKNWLQLLANELINNKCIGITGPIVLTPKYDVISSGLRVKLKNSLLYEIWNFDTVATTGNRYALLNTCLLVKKELFIKANMFTEELNEQSSVINLSLTLLKMNYATRLVSNSQLIDFTASQDLLLLKKQSRSLQKYWKKKDIFAKDIKTIECLDISKKIPTISIFGTCRVDIPFKLLQEKKLVNIENTAIPGYTHTTKEILQQLQNMKGQFTLNDSFIPLVSKNGLNSYMNKNLDSTDIIILEISSLRLLSINGIYFRSNLVRDYLNKNLNTTRFEEFWKDLLHSELKYPLDLNYDIDFSSLTLESKYITENISCIVQSKKDFLNDLDEILLYLNNKKIIFVSHFDMYINNSNIRVPERVQIVEWLTNFTKRNNIPFYNPRYKLEEVGISKGLVDNSHYTKEFESILATDYIKLVQNTFKSLY